MKKVFKISLAVMISAVVIAVSALSAFAAGDFTLNGKAKAKVGDTVTYTLNLSDCEDKLEGIQMYVFYDKNYLEIDPNSLEFPELKSTVYNANYKTGIAFSWTSVTDLVSFKNKKTLMTVDFEVKKAGNTDITYFITEMYGDDLTYFKSFTLTNDITVNDREAVRDEAPILTDDTELKNAHQGSFPNYSDGKGEKNGTGKKHVMVTGVPTKPVVNNGETDATTVTKENGADTTTIIVVLGITFAVIAIIVLVILRRHFTKDNDEDAKS